MTGPSTILYVGAFRFPAGDPAAARVLGIAKALRDAGHEVIFAPNLHQDRPPDHDPDGRWRYQGFEYLPTANMAATRRARLERLWRIHLTGRAVLGRIRGLELPALSAVIVYHGCAPLLWALRGLCRRRGVALIADCTEWYDPWQVPGGPLSPFRWDSELRMRWLQKRLDGVLAISSYLQDYYAAAGVPTLRVPPLVDLHEDKWCSLPSPTADQMRLVYGGTPGRKDLIGNAIRGLPALRRAGVPVRLTLLGPSSTAVRSLMGGDGLAEDDAQAGVECLGRIPQHEVPQHLAAADFSILLRPRRRFTQAGFPTKLVESLAAGVPVLVNPTSDVGQYVRDGQQGLHLADATPEAFCAGVRRAWDLPRDRWQAMRLAARRCAAEAFDYRRHVSRLDDFVRQTIDVAARGA